MAAGRDMLLVVAPALALARGAVRLARELGAAVRALGALVALGRARGAGELLPVGDAARRPGRDDDVAVGQDLRVVRVEVALGAEEARDVEDRERLVLRVDDGDGPLERGQDRQAAEGRVGPDVADAVVRL